MEATTEKKKPGNPAFTKKKPIPQLFNGNPDKIYEFELINTVDYGKPVDRDNDKPLDAPYPRVFTRPNEGISFDEYYDNGNGTKGRARAWRYIVGQPSIWADEQPMLEAMDKKEISDLLGREENQIEFVKGKCRVSGMNALKLQALLIHDAYQGKRKQLKEVPRLYRLVNPDALIEKQLESGDLEFKAMKLAYECSDDEMLRASFVLGINIDDITPAGINRIKSQFRARAKYDPTNPKAAESLEFFISVMENPVTKLKYIFSQGFKHGIISKEQQPGKLTWALPNTVIMDLPANSNTVEALSTLVLDHDELAMSVFEQIEIELNNIIENSVNE